MKLCISKHRYTNFLFENIFAKIIIMTIITSLIFINFSHV